MPSSTVECGTSFEPVISRLIESCALKALFQPIVRLSDGAVIGHEGLIRGPAGGALESPVALFARAHDEELAVELERAAGKACIDAYFDGATNKDALLFVNYSAAAINSAPDRDALLLHADAKRLVIELTEQSRIPDLDVFAASVNAVRASGARFAVDDYGVANASLSLWAHLAPHYVKVDRYFIHGIAQNAVKFEAVKSMVSFANATGTLLIAEGVESPADLRIVRDLGIPFAQGFLLGRPSQTPATRVSESAAALLRSQQIAVYPATKHRRADVHESANQLEAMRIEAPTLKPEACNDDAVHLFNTLPSIHALAVVDSEGTPVALINRRSLMDQFALPYHRELFGKRACMQFANREPVSIERTASIETIATLLTDDEQHALSDGFIVVDDGKYVGLIAGASAVRAVTELRLEAARHANPLTFLPGNLPLGAHIARLIDSGVAFVACYADLDHFKPFNDRYGYWQGDAVLKAAADALSSACDPDGDFLGHIGGDDFLILFQSGDWYERISRAAGEFNEKVRGYYSTEDRAAGGIVGEDRFARQAFFDFVRMSIGGVAVRPGQLRAAAQLSKVASIAKQRAKRDTIGIVVIEFTGDGGID
ncbi:GGDEF domain-containing protein [Caballeronia concitans]|uniref:Diguanylate cyclase n=1 Tax=Caballeronia concitans TaxID=1777133 RepID=A0A658QX12_9BURK|nr:phosphodiesterase [Caballeronia concitans]KIG03006.1 diguanylate cyclase/phosphodiesterase with CBS domain containing protein [Burkholderia sp. MR1]SAL30419.1 diguanylate cyclase [Caballeronia concitans]